MTLAESATPVDVVSTHGETEPVEEFAQTSLAVEPESSRDGLTLGLAIAGLVAGLAALGVTLLRR